MDTDTAIKTLVATIKGYLAAGGCPVDLCGEGQGGYDLAAAMAALGEDDAARAIRKVLDA